MLFFLFSLFSCLDDERLGVPWCQMPGLPTRPSYYNIDIDTKTGKIIGLS